MKKLGNWDLLAYRITPLKDYSEGTVCWLEVLYGHGYWSILGRFSSHREAKIRAGR